MLNIFNVISGIYLYFKKHLEELESRFYSPSLATGRRFFFFFFFQVETHVGTTPAAGDTARLCARWRAAAPLRSGC